MSESHDEKHFWSIVDEVIELANNKSGEVDLGIVNSALLNAAARFNAFYVAASSESKADLKEDKDEAIHKFGGEYKRRMADNLDDYIENYKVYMREEDD